MSALGAVIIPGVFASAGLSFSVGKSFFFFFFFFVFFFFVGSNDASNAIGTSVGSRALNVRAAIVISGIFEFLGVMLVGRLVSLTLAYGLIDPLQSGISTDVFVLGMLAALMSSFVFLIVATLLGMPVSTTHTIVAGIVSFGLLERGGVGINTTTIRNVGISWIVSPVLGVVFGALVYWILHRLVLDTPNGERNNRFVFPVMAGLTFGAVVAFVVAAIAKLLNFPYWIPAVLFVSLAIVTGLVVYFFAFPWWLAHRNSVMFQKFANLFMQPPQNSNTGLIADAEKEEASANQENDDIGGYQVDKEEHRSAAQPVMTPDKVVMAALDDERDPGGEEALAALPQQAPYSALMIVTACVMAFGHGANDIGNSCGPFSVILEWTQTGRINSPTYIVPIWVYIEAGALLVAGVALLGTIVMRTIGEKISRLNFVAGFSAQFSTCCIVLFATLLGLPVSTTHIIVGSVAGISLVTPQGRKHLKGQWKELLKIVIGWVLTLLVAAGLTLFFFWALKFCLPV
jgi:phosphate/sulfate permease